MAKENGGVSVEEEKVSKEEHISTAQEEMLEEWEESLRGREDKLKGCQMREAKYSISFSLLQQGFRTQVTIRNNETLDGLITDYQNALGYMISKGGVPAPAQSRSNGSNNAPTAVGNGGLGAQARPVCEFCGSTDMKYIGTTRDGRTINNWVCQNPACKKWKSKTR
jgi:hypothetical protein